MATQNEYDALTNRLLPIILAEEHKDVPVMFQGMIPADAPRKAAVALAHMSIDFIDAYRAARLPTAPA